jgi:hypothetical protein
MEVKRRERERESNNNNEAPPPNHPISPKHFTPTTGTKKNKILNPQIFKIHNTIAAKSNS